MASSCDEGRRAFLRRAAGTAAFATVSACAPRSYILERAPAARRFARVHVSPERVIRTVAGLRPFRPSGFVVGGQRIGGKLLVHNYGHGGAGITLSWGTSQLAVEELGGWSGARDRCAVIGCGAVGLATARLLQRRGAAVTIYAKDLPPATTSNVAGGQWGPFSVFDRGKTTAAFDDQFARARRLAWRLFQDLPGSEFGIRWIEITLTDDGRYVFPRSDGILLGGTRERGVWTLEPDRDAERRILEGHRAFFGAMR